MSEMTGAQAIVYEALTDDWMGPTEVGMKCCKPYGSASSWSVPKLRALIKKGLVEYEGGKYRRVKP